MLRLEMWRYALLIIAFCTSTVRACDRSYAITDDEELTLSSPGYPQSYAADARCTYIITVPAGERITMDSSDFSLRARETAFSAVGDTISVYEGGGFKMTGKFQKADGPPGFISVGSQITIWLRIIGAGSTSGLGKFVLRLRKYVAFPEVYSCKLDATKRVAHNQFCDGVQDCPGGEDEFCLTDCGKQTYQPNWNDLKTVKIVNGSEAVPHSWPWQIGMLSDGQLFCGGSLIAPKWVMTAAHCCASVQYNSAGVDVLVGAHNRNKMEPSARRIGVKTIYSHPGYVTSTINNDYCLLHLKQQADFTAETYPVCLPSGDIAQPTGAECYVSGWGTTRYGANSSPPELRQTMKRLTDHSECSAIHNGRITKEMMCTYNRLRDTCQGDSGGPLVCRVPGEETLFELRGVTSWGRGCGQDGVPGVHANPVYSMDWILKTIMSTNYEGWSNIYSSEVTTTASPVTRVSRTTTVSPATTSQTTTALPATTTLWTTTVSPAATPPQTTSALPATTAAQTTTGSPTPTTTPPYNSAVGLSGFVWGVLIALICLVLDS